MPINKQKAGTDNAVNSSLFNSRTKISEREKDYNQNIIPVIA